jgi:hypothetical protein
MKNRQTTYEQLKAQMQNHSNYRLVLLWNALQTDQTSAHLVPLQDLLKERGINVRRGSRCTRKFVDDDTLRAARNEAHARRRMAFELIPSITLPAPAKPTLEKITPVIDADRVVSKAGGLLATLREQATWTPETVDPFLLKHTPGLKRTLSLAMKTRYKAYANFFRDKAWKWYRIQVINVRCGRTFKALIKIGRTLIELRAGVRGGVSFVQAVPMAWSDLT